MYNKQHVKHIIVKIIAIWIYWLTLKLCLLISERTLILLPELKLRERCRFCFCLLFTSVSSKSMCSLSTVKKRKGIINKARPRCSKIICQSNFWVSWKNPMAWPFNLNVTSSEVFTWYYLFSVKFLLWSLWTKSYGVTIQIRPVQQYPHMVLVT